MTYSTGVSSLPKVHIDVPRMMTEIGGFTLTDRSFPSKEPLEEPCVPPGHVHDHVLY